MTPPTDFRSVLRNEAHITRVGSVLVFVLILVGVATFVLARKAVKLEASSVGVLKALNDVEAAEALFTRDMLVARLGLSPASDTVGRDAAMLRASVRLLAGASRPDDPLVLRIAARADEKIALAQLLSGRRDEIEAGRAGLADLRDRLAATGIDPDMRIALQRIDASISRLTDPRDPDVARGAADIVAQASSPSLTPLLAEQRTLMRRQRAQEQHRVGILLIGLYALAVVVGAALVGAGHVLLKRTRALRGMIVVEQVAAQISSLLMGCEADEIEGRLAPALGLLGRACGFDRACILATGDAEAVWHWRRDGVRQAEGWPLLLRDELDAMDAVPASIFRVPGESFRPSPGLAAHLETAGIHRWTCAKVKGAGRTIGLLCLDRSDSRAPEIVETEDGLAMLADLIGHALMRRDLHRRHRVLEGKLRRAERLEALGTFASGIAHNFNNVLGVIEGQVELAMDALPANAAALANILQIEQAGRRAQEMVDEILAFGRPERKNVRLIPVAASVAEAVAHVGVTRPDTPRMMLTGSHVQGATLASEAQLQQVFVNLIQNAVQASPAHGQVSIKVEAVASGPVALSHGDLAPGPYIRVTVSDQGAGMTEKTLARLFQPFFSTKPAGTGLGLATALETVRQAGGGIHVRSAVQIGSSFEVWLPEAPCQVEAPASARAVLLINTDRSILLQDEECVAALGYEPFGFAEPGTALHTLAATPNRYDAIIVEHSILARWTEPQFVSAVRLASSPGTPIVLSTASANADAMTLTRLGFTDVVRRPWQMSALSDALRVPDRGRPKGLSPELTVAAQAVMLPGV